MEKYTSREVKLLRVVKPIGSFREGRTTYAVSECLLEIAGKEHSGYVVSGSYMSGGLYKALHPYYTLERPTIEFPLGENA